VRIVYIKLRSRFQQRRTCGSFFSLLISNVASQAKLQTLQLYYICMCQVNSTAGSDGWMQQCVANPPCMGQEVILCHSEERRKNGRE